MDWSVVTRRVVIAAAAPHPEDVVLLLGDDWEVALSLAARVSRVLVRPTRPGPAVPSNVVVQLGLDWLAAPPSGTSVVVMHDSLRSLAPAVQRRLVNALGVALSPRALLVVGDVMWSMPADVVDAPEQYGESIQNAPTVAGFERLLRESGFLPDIHRFGVGRAVCVALKA
ncbi:MAG: hypothetical protein EXR71_18030 [Myxococcales bacterium]|nr:hypothetical protein [Myxococcales bacterium]